PWRGPWGPSVRDVLGRARRAATGFRSLGIEAGDVVSLQLPNWVETAAAFWGLPLLGAVAVRIVHFYGAKEVEFILVESGAEVHVTADRFGRNDYLEMLKTATP